MENSTELQKPSVDAKGYHNKKNVTERGEKKKKKNSKAEDFLVPIKLTPTTEGGGIWGNFKNPKNL